LNVPLKYMGLPLPNQLITDIKLDRVFMVLYQTAGLKTCARRRWWFKSRQSGG